VKSTKKDEATICAALMDTKYFVLHTKVVNPMPISNPCHIGTNRARKVI